MGIEPTIYDEVEYPSMLHPQTHPSHLAAIARLHGLDAPDPATANVLEIAGGDGINLIGMALAYPQARFHSFDLSIAAVARGRTAVEAAGLENVRIEQGDVIDLAERMEGTFDYVIVNGLYAWVPEAVRAATLKLVGRVLSPEGVAFLSYNATPGGYLRLAVREMLLREMLQGKDAQDGVRRARTFLEDFAVPREEDDLPRAALRSVAKPLLDKTDGFLFHDDLGGIYAPQALTEVATAAAEHGLAFLNDAMPTLVFNALPGSDMDEDEVLRFAQTEDYKDCAFFHRTLFVRSGRRPLRRLDPDSIVRLFATARVKRIDRQKFQFRDTEIEIGDDRLCDFLELLNRVAPARLPLSGFAESPAYCEALVQLFQRGVIQLHAVPYPGPREPGERPMASPLVRSQVAAGTDFLFTMEHGVIAIRDEAPRAFLTLLDGTRDRAALAAEWATSGFAHEADVETALRQLCAAGLLIA